MSKPNGKFVALLFSLFVLFHLTAFFNNWYLKFDGLDKASHFLGGFALALAAIYVLRVRGYKASWQKVLFLVLAMALAWEFYEYVLDKFITYDILKTQRGGWPDTLGDLLAGFLGASSPIFLRKRPYK